MKGAWVAVLKIEGRMKTVEWVAGWLTDAHISEWDRINYTVNSHINENTFHPRIGMTS